MRNKVWCENTVLTFGEVLSFGLKHSTSTQSEEATVNSSQSRWQNGSQKMRARIFLEWGLRSYSLNVSDFKPDSLVQRYFSAPTCAIWSTFLSLWFTTFNTEDAHDRYNQSPEQTSWWVTCPHPRTQDAFCIGTNLLAKEVKYAWLVPYLPTRVTLESVVLGTQWEHHYLCPSNGSV